MWQSTRSTTTTSFASAIIHGLAPDGGLYVPSHLPKLLLIETMKTLSYKDIAYYVLSKFLDDFSHDEINSIVNKSYQVSDFPQGEIALESYPGFTLLRLDQGPTMAFKDMALMMLPHLIETAKQKLLIKESLVFLTATSGDTGGAALAGFSHVNGAQLMVLYPDQGVSAIQRNQMHHFTSKNRQLIPVTGNFDDCQRLVKEAFQTLKIEGIRLSSSNSINIGRLLPQIIYYVYSYLQLVNQQKITFGESIDVVVPTGNFGNIMAANYARMMGLPIHRLVSATNQNDVIHRFIQTGIYDARHEFKVSWSPAMDILISSNVERLLFELYHHQVEEVDQLMTKLRIERTYALSQEAHHLLRETFDSYAVSEQDTLQSIRQFYDQHHHLIDPHTAIGYAAYQRTHSTHYTLVVSTAHPFKFPEAIFEAFHLRAPLLLKDQLKALGKLDHSRVDKRFNDLFVDHDSVTCVAKEQVLATLIKKIGEIHVSD